MTKSKLLIAALVLIATLSPLAGVAGAAPQTQDAELAIEQPHYVDGAVERTSENGTTVYKASRGPLEVAPRNFEAENVVDYGVATEGGGAELSYDREMGQFEFSAEKAGTYAVYFSVERSVSVQNESGNGSHIETRSQRYVANIRMSQQEEMVHMAAGALEETREKADKWDDWVNQVEEVQEIIGNGILVKTGLAEAPSVQETMQAMVDAVLTFKAPLYMLSGNFTTILFLVASTLGGWLFVGLVILPLLATIGLLAYRSNRFETTEAEEGRLSKRAGEQQQAEDKRKLANTTHNDVFDDDYLAGAMREEGDDPLVATGSLMSKLPQRHVLHSRLQAMAQAGWVAKVTRRGSTDGGDDGDATIVDAEVCRADRVADGTDTESLEVDVDDELLDALDWDQAEIWDEFDLPAAVERGDVDPTEMQPTRVDTYDIDELAEMTDLDLRQFDDESHVGQNVVELFEFIREHPLTDKHGKPGTLRWGLEQHLRSANLLRDRYHMPVDGYAEMWEAAIAYHDAGAEAEETRKRVEEGGYA